VSSALAVAGVTAVLRELLDAWLTDQEVNGALGGASASVTAVPPDTVELTGANAAPKLNLFLHQVSQNAGWRNVDLPSRDERGRRTKSPPLALDLHYLLTAYGPLALQAEVLLGYGMQLLHEMPVLGRQAIADSMPTDLEDSHLAQQVEQIKVTPEPMTTEELSRLWSALQAKYRPTASYQVSVVLIDADAGGRATLPVLTRGPVDPVSLRERGILAQADLTPAFPGITTVRPPNDGPGAELSDLVIVEGHHLDGSNRVVHLENRALGLDRVIPALAGTESGRVRFTVPNQPAALAVGTHALRVRLQRPGEAALRETNRLSLTIVPRITTPLPLSVTRDSQGTATVDLNVRPQVRPHQRASLILADLDVPAEPHPVSTGALTFKVVDAPVGSHLVRVRVDGFESLIVDRTASPPTFLDRRVVIS
jgi:Pvc16 N-terminal domain